MIVPSLSALALLWSLCYGDASAVGPDAVSRESPRKGNQDPLKAPINKAKYQAACPAYEHYSRFTQTDGIAFPKAVAALPNLRLAARGTDYRRTHGEDG
ncbi:hypothetical protein LTR60_005277 [Cryomyces antarcticus]|nr:hypothetical protein LTR60_005277 [Cryomyces antarcticus]